MNTPESSPASEPSTTPRTIPRYVALEPVPALQELRQWIEHPSKPTADIEAFFTLLFDSVSLAGNMSVDDLNELANDVGYGDMLYGQHELLRHEQHRLAMLVMRAGEAIARQLDALGLYNEDGLFPYHFRSYHGNGLLLFENHG